MESSNGAMNHHRNRGTDARSNWNPRGMHIGRPSRVVSKGDTSVQHRVRVLNCTAGRDRVLVAVKGMGVMVSLSQYV